MEAPRGRYSSAVEEDIMFRPCHENDPVQNMRLQFPFQHEAAL